MFWRMTGLSAASPVSNSSSSFRVSLRDKAQVEQLLRYVVEEVPEDAEKKRSFKFPFIACEIFTCEIDVILRTLIEDEELMDLLFSFLKPDHPHSTLLSGYFSKVVICLMLRKTAQLMSYVQGHPEIVSQLVDLIGITSIMEVLIRLIGADEAIYSNYGDTLQWLENTDVLEMIADKFSSSIVEFISVLLTIGSETAEKELIRQSAIKRSIDLFFEYSYNNFLHHHVENIIVSCLEGKRTELVEHVLIVTLSIFLIYFFLYAQPTVPSEGKTPPRIGNVGHMTRISNKLIQLGNSNSTIHAHLQENSQWVDWQAGVLVKRNEVENVYHWACGRPTSLHDRGRDSDDDDFRDRDYDVAALANNLSQAFRYGIYSNDDMEEAQGSLERDDEDVYFDDESAEVVISSLRLGDDQDGSLFTNSNWFTFDGERGINDRLAASVPSSSPNSEETSLGTEETDDCKVIGTEDEMETVYLGNGSIEEAKDVVECSEQPNCSIQGEALEDTEGMERHPDAANGDTDVGTNETASAAPESLAPSVEAERTTEAPSGSSDLDTPVSEASSDPNVNGSEPTNTEASSEQVTHDTDVQQPTNEVTHQDVGAKDTDVIKSNE
ncbi:hypothetical protein PR202_ga10683 [Eleusine coracana subsp. coracana]|uniref:SIT4 phosphatase-associated family protein n=1 Tax=Eleusine coracana subsp. coracana TaxID=191504 RepID=A0AAV5C7I8_ELECO|nr:hypothetical protein PR202_ga10683 [Eleusine coracana subsp. coracana]